MLTWNKRKVGLALFSGGAIILMLSFYLYLDRSVPMHSFTVPGCLSCLDSFDLYLIRIKILAILSGVLAAIGLATYVSGKASFSLVSLRKVATET